MKLSIVVCTRNQRDTILSRLNHLWKAAPPGWQVEALVIDDHSTDGTRDLLQALERENLQVIYQPRSRYRGTCWQAALTHLSGDYVLLQRNPPDHALASLEALAAGVGEGVVAVYAAPSTEGSARHRRAFITHVLNTLFGGDLDEVMGTGKLVRADVLKALNLRGDGATLEIDLTVKLLRAGLDIRQVPIAGQRPPGPGRMQRLAALGALVSARLDPTPIWKRGHRPANL